MGSLALRGSAEPKDLEPDLAERWESSPDGKVWTFHLRQGVKFHGGWGTLDADVVYSLQRSADPKRSTFSSDFAAVDKVEKVDALTVRISLESPRRQLPRPRVDSTVATS